MCNIPDEVREQINVLIRAYDQADNDLHASDVVHVWIDNLPTTPEPDEVREWIEEALNLLEQPELVYTNRERRKEAIASGYTMLDKLITTLPERPKAQHDPTR